MNSREYFAGLAMQSFLTRAHEYADATAHFDKIVSKSWKLADMMVANKTFNASEYDDGGTL